MIVCLKSEKSTFMLMLGVIVGTDSETAFSACIFDLTIVYHKAGDLMKEKILTNKFKLLRVFRFMVLCICQYLIHQS